MSLLSASGQFLSDPFLALQAFVARSLSLIGPKLDPTPPDGPFILQEITASQNLLKPAGGRGERLQEALQFQQWVGDSLEFDLDGSTCQCAL